MLGIRHHGPGSARMVRAALEAVEPSLVLIEGPPDADPLVPHVPDLTPPVALLLHDDADPAKSAFWPFAGFSPEWQALSWAAVAGVPARFADMAASAFIDPVDRILRPRRKRVHLDPLGLLAEAAGFDDPERWWEDVVEHSAVADPLLLAAAVGEAMGALREEYADEIDEETLVREAAMRQILRKGLKEFDGPIVFVCGAWHAPALMTLPPASHDTALLRGLKKRKVSGSWVPWSYGRLAATSGYGAGVDSPGWYSHLFERSTAGDVVPRWFARTCQVLRSEGLPASTASAVEAVRLADTLAALRGRPSPGLSEVSDATLAVLCGGDSVPLRLVRDRLVIGEQLGAVGDDVPRSPLARDLERLQKRLRLPVSPEENLVALDLRKDVGRERSRLFRRLLVLDVPWGELEPMRGLGTFAERWVLRWDPSLAVSVAAAARHGTTVAAAAERVLLARAVDAERVSEAASLLATSVGCELPDSVVASREALDRCAAAATDALDLLGALPELSDMARYGSVRGTDPELLRTALHGLLSRGAVGLPLACRGIDDRTAEQAVRAVDGAHQAVRRLADSSHAELWVGSLVKLVETDDAHGLPAGRATRLLWESGDLDADAVAVRLHRAVTASAGSTAFVAGFLRGSATMLGADPRLLALVDAWLAGLSDASFDDALPLLRRAVAEFSSAERRTLASRVSGEAGPVVAAGDEWDPERAARLVSYVEGLLTEASR